VLPIGDHTPEGFVLARPAFTERVFKWPIRRYGYPLYNFLIHHWLTRIYGRTASFTVDQWLWGQRGNDMDAHRRRINRLFALRGKSILIPGCGTGRDVSSWLPYHPDSLICVDWFNYQRAWDLLRRDVEARLSTTHVEFVQADVTSLEMFPDHAFDLIGSDAVLEHVRELATALKEFNRLLRTGGLLYATFGPLWYCWGGDHISGYDGLSGGYNHLLLDQEDYERYLDGAGAFQHSEHDGRTFIRHDLFSYLGPSQYLRLLQEAGFERVFVGAIVDPRAVKYLATYVECRKRLENVVEGYLDLVITGMIVIYRKGSQ
jgi:SAM-dependent methyltransferase